MECATHGALPSNVEALHCVVAPCAQVRDEVKPGWSSLDDQDASTHALLQQLVLKKYRSPSARYCARL